MPDVLQRVEHRRQVRGGLLEVELVGEGLQVDVGGVHLREERAPRLGVDIAGGDRHRLDTQRVAGDGGVHRVLGEDDRVVVGEGHAGRPAGQRGFGDALRRGFVLQAVHLAALRDVPVLAELAGQVAAGGAEGQHGRAGQEVVQRLLLDRVEREARAAAIGGEHDRIAPALAHEAQAALALVQPAVARTQVALQAAVGHRVPPARRAGRIAAGRGRGVSGPLHRAAPRTR